MLGLALSLVASAQTGGVDGHGQVPPPVEPDPASPLTVLSPYNDRRGAWSVGGVLEHVQDPLVEVRLLEPGAPAEFALLDEVYGVNLGARYALHERLGLSLVAPVWMAAAGEVGAGGPALGDVHLWLPVGLILNDPDTAEGFGLSAVPYLDLPTGASSRFLGDTAVNLGVVGVVGYGLGVLSMRGNLGIGVGKQRVFANQSVGGDTLYGGGAVGVMPTPALGIHLEGRLGVGLSSENQVTIAPPGPNDGRGAAAPLELLLTARYAFAGGPWMVAGAGRGVTAGVGAARLRAYAGFGYGYDPEDDTVIENVRAALFRLVDPAGDPIAGGEIRVDGEVAGVSDASGELALDGLRWRRGVEATGPHHETVAVAQPDDGGVVDVVLPWKDSRVELRIQDQAGAPVTATLVATPLDDAERTPARGSGDALMLQPGMWRIEVDGEGFGGQAREVFVDPGGREPVTAEVTLLEDDGGSRMVLRLVDLEGEPVVGARVLLDGQPVGTSADGGLVEVDKLPAGEHRLQILHEDFTEMDRTDLVLEDGENAVTTTLQRVPGSVRVIARGPEGRIVEDAVVRFDGPRRLAPAPLGERGERVQTLGPGTWNLFITSAEFGFQEREVVVPEDSYELIVVEVVLQPGESGAAHLALRVVDPSGAPVDGAEVVMDGKAYGSTSTGGELSLRGLLPGARTLQVAGEWFRPLDPIDLTLIDGLQERVVTLRWQPGTARVIARSPAGPVPDTVVRFLGSEALPPAPLGPMADSLFTLVPGDWQVLLTSESAGLHQRDLVIPEDSDRLHRVEVVMNPDEGGLANLNLRVVDAGGQEIPGAEVFLDGVALGTTTNTGGISLTGLSVGSRELEVRAPLFVTRAEPVRLLEGDLDKEMVLEWADGAVRVRIEDAEGLPVTDAVVRMLGPAAVPPAPVDAYGERVFGLLAGTWQILAMSESQGLAQAPVEVLGEGEGLVDVVVTMPADTGGLASLLVRVADEDEAPIRDALVRMDGQEVGRTGSGGALLLEGLAPGPSRLTVEAVGFEEMTALEVGLELGANERIVPLRFLPVPVSVTVEDTSGAPVDAQVQAVGPVDVDPVSTGSDGAVSLGLRPGAWQIIAATETLGPSRAEVVLEAGAESVSPVALVVAPTRVSVAGENVVIREKVKFDFGKATLRPDSRPILQEVADTLLSRPGIIRVEVQGHADDIGGVVANQALSQQRAEAVLQALVALGVPPEMLTARGYGLQRPIDTNETEEGRANNRRVAFDIVEQ